MARCKHFRLAQVPQWRASTGPGNDARAVLAESIRALTVTQLIWTATSQLVIQLSKYHSSCDAAEFGLLLKVGLECSGHHQTRTPGIGLGRGCTCCHDQDENTSVINACGGLIKSRTLRTSRLLEHFLEAFKRSDANRLGSRFSLDHDFFTGKGVAALSRFGCRFFLGRHLAKSW